MPRKPKVDLIEEARLLGLPADEDEHYDDIFERVKAARVEERDEEVEAEPDPEPFEEPVVERDSARSSWSPLGVWQGRGRPS